MKQSWIIAGLALVGLLVSGYLLITYVTPVPLICDNTGGCHVVRASAYAAFFGIPTPAYGVVFYTVLGVFAAIEKRSWLKTLTLAGLLVSLVLSYIEAFVLGAWCIWCVASALVATAAFLVVWIPRKGKVKPLPQDPSRIKFG